MLDFFLGLLCGALLTMGCYTPVKAKKPLRPTERKAEPLPDGVIKGDGEGDEVFVIDKDSA